MPRRTRQQPSQTGRQQKPLDDSPVPWSNREAEQVVGPRRPDIGSAPDVKDLLKKMRRVDPDTAKRYRQRAGQ